jgi:hypothetical protein
VKIAVMSRSMRGYALHIETSMPPGKAFNKVKCRALTRQVAPNAWSVPICGKNLKLFLRVLSQFLKLA